MSKLIRSVHKEVAVDNIKKFSSFPDFLNYYIEIGRVKSLEDLIDNHSNLLGTFLFNWFQQGQIACVFAQRLARQPVEVKWQTFTLKGEINAEELSSVLDNAAENFEALQIIFPGPGSAEQAIKIIKDLCQHPSWICKKIDCMPDEEGKSFQVGLRWQSPNGQYISWVLGIAPFEGMPFTRKFVGAPFIALVFRPSAPTAFAKTPIEDGKSASHLAHMNDELGENEEKRTQIRTQTIRAKAALLGNDLRSTARAKVTFSFPDSYESLLKDVISTEES